MVRKLFIIALLTLALGVAVSSPAPAAIGCTCGLCTNFPTVLCYDNQGHRWTCGDYALAFC